MSAWLHVHGCSPLPRLGSAPAAASAAAPPPTHLLRQLQCCYCPELASVCRGRTRVSSRSRSAVSRSAACRFVPAAYRFVRSARARASPAAASATSAADRGPGDNVRQGGAGRITAVGAAPGIEGVHAAPVADPHAVVASDTAAVVRLCGWHSFSWVPNRQDLARADRPRAAAPIGCPGAAAPQRRQAPGGHEPQRCQAAPGGHGRHRCGGPCCAARHRKLRAASWRPAARRGSRSDDSAA